MTEWYHKTWPFSFGLKEPLELPRGAPSQLLWWKPPQHRGTCGHSGATDTLQPLTAGMSENTGMCKATRVSGTWCASSRHRLRARGCPCVYDLPQMSLCPMGEGTHSHIHSPDHAQQNMGTCVLALSPSLVPDIERKKFRLPQRSPCAVPFFFFPSFS